MDPGTIFSAGILTGLMLGFASEIMVFALGALAGVLRGAMLLVGMVTRACALLEGIRDEVRKQNLRWRG